MKKKSIFSVAIIALIISGCFPKERFDFKLSMVPEAGNNVIDSSYSNETVRILKWRLINFGISLENVNFLSAPDKIELTINKIDTSDTSIIEKLLTTPGKIEFWETYENGEILKCLSDANNMLRNMKVVPEEVIPTQTAKVKTKDSLSLEDQLYNEMIEDDTTGVVSMKKFKTENPLFGIMIPRVDGQGQPIPSCMIGLVTIEDTAIVSNYLNMKEIKVLFPRDIKFYWSRNPYEWDDTKKLFELHAIKSTNLDGQAPLDGREITSSNPVPARSGGAMVNISMNSEGAKIWARMTRDNIDRCIAVILDGSVLSYPRVIAEITSGNTQIASNFSLPDARYLASIFSTGGENLPLKLKINESQIIEKE